MVCIRSGFVYKCYYCIESGMIFCHIVIRRLSVQDESTGSILSPSDISYDNTEDDLVGFANRSIQSILVLQILCYNRHPNNKLDINPLQKINNKKTDA